MSLGACALDPEIAAFDLNKDNDVTRDECSQFKNCQMVVGFSAGGIGAIPFPRAVNTDSGNVPFGAAPLYEIAPNATGNVIVGAPTGGR